MSKWDGVALPKLTRDIEQCKRDLAEWGYCLLADLITDDQRKRLLDRLQEQARLEREQGVAWLGNGGRGGQTWVGSPAAGEPLPAWQTVRTLLNKGRPFLDLVQHPKLAELNNYLFQNNPWYLASSNGIIIRKGAVAMVTHVDQQHIPFVTPIPVINNTMVCLSEFTEKNGATRVTPGSHRGPPPKIVLDEKLKDGVNPEVIEQVPAEAPPGAVIVFEGRLWHSSGAATADTERYSITCAYSQAFLRQHDNYTASLHDRVYHNLTSRERELLGFRANPFGRIDPRFPGDRTNTDVSNPYIPELGASSVDRAIAVPNAATIQTLNLAQDTKAQ
ncbi:phytanoyl-CoA dioxygenase family protein [Bradyrhizobium sp. Pear77]|uniref:phytanoyl-CoA dioxygenase family protein n=1 Tax=Bradyrhizobium altum TaxID=1571202 RepID=UPI001E4CE24A|nr:phytanoyl-CoA dioxygenase family protein [Bradyrhizobium altum]MCC8952754.1 phytanoyl-CoA dioxygenase family protein [Bradyrhizobium altum]